MLIAHVVLIILLTGFATGKAMRYCEKVGLSYTRIDGVLLLGELRKYL